MKFNKYLATFLLMSLPFVLIYGQVKNTYNYAVKKGEQLQLDVYSPDTIRSGKLYPTVLWVHGGGFAGGSRDYKDDVALCEKLTQLGYMAISISYRLTRKDTKTGFGCDCPKKDKLQTFEYAVSDFYDAALYVIEHHKDLNVDPDYLIAGGSSAGAETVLNAVYLKEFFLEDLNKYDSIHFAGVWSLAGAVVDADYITKENTIPTALFHGTADQLVPFASAPHHYCKPESPGYLMLDGSKVIADKLQELQKPLYFYEVIGAGHEIASIPIDERLNAVLQFFEECIKKEDVIQYRKIIGKEKLQ